MGRILKAIFLLLLLAAIGTVIYAYLGNMAPVTSEQRIEVDLTGAKSGG
ncbi:MAG: hypothetical protein R3D78_11625 [Paracoccaceae bacterium]